MRDLEVIDLSWGGSKSEAIQAEAKERIVEPNYHKGSRADASEAGPDPPNQEEAKAADHPQTAQKAKA